MTSPVLVGISMTLYQVRELNVKFQYLQTNVWLTFTWKDDYLTWNPSKYGGLRLVNIPCEKVWRPDIVLYNSVDDERLVTEILANTQIKLSHDGMINWHMPAMLKTSCKIKMADYPFDIQRCPFQFGSWTHNGFEIDVKNTRDSAFLSNFITNGEYEILGVPSVRNEKIYECCPEPYPDVTFTVVLKRRPLFVIMNLILPCVFLNAIGLLVFYLPPGSGEKIGLAVTILLSMTVFLLLVMESIPPTSEVVPLLQQFFLASIGLLAIATMLSVVIVNFHCNGEHSMSPPHCVRVFTYDVLARITCMRPIVNVHLESFKDFKMSKPSKDMLINVVKAAKSKVKNIKSDVVLLNYKSPWKQNGDVVHDSSNGKQNGSFVHDSIDGKLDGVIVQDSSDPLPEIEDSGTNISRNGNSSENMQVNTAILEELKQQRISKKELSYKKQQFREIESEWRVIALILDRVFLFFYTGLSIAAILGVFLRTPADYYNSQGN